MSENVTHLPSQAPESETGSMADRIDAAVQLNDELADFLRTGEHPGLDTYLEDIGTIADLIAAAGERFAEGPMVDGLADHTIPRAGFLIERLVRSARVIEEHEMDRRAAEREAALAAEEAARDEQRKSPAEKVKFLAFLHGVDERSMFMRSSELEELERQAPEVAAVVAEYLSDRHFGKPASLYVDPADAQELGVEEQASAAQAHGRHLVVMDDGDPENVRTWLVEDSTAEALQPLVQTVA